MRIRRRSRKTHRRVWQRGFTLIEVMVIVMVVGILAATAAPSFGSLLDSIKVNQTVTDLRTVLQDTQRQAIRNSQVCTIQVPNTIGNGNSYGNSKKKIIQGNCLTSGSPELADNIDLATNLQSSSTTSGSSDTIALQFGTFGSAAFSIQSAVQSPATPRDPTGKVVAFVAENPKVQKKCVAISSTLGLTRIGTYTGGTSPSEITDSGVCTALDWKQQ
jgi:prepilin-type N-terminal cleavage/methylation domain-containing protein